LEIIIQEDCPDIEVIIKCPKATDEIQKLASLLQREWHDMPGQKMPGTKDGQTFLVDRHDILYFESVDKRYFIYTAADVYETALKLYEIEEWLTAGIFFRSSKSQVINIKKIKSLCPEFGGRLEVVMENGEILMVSRQYAKILKERLGL